ncbi:hypothetical protein LCI18_015141 [Fusarium solani-melongenae]|uniref:Uncharacterized protein n=1 Tax=Fusarium solani subsp. cucurbitae TaxID=2747967 RepID=A0ACD3ZSY5_FUSSC|nr:hypothetical protein LCI18_015141 [Fusarium solani-melongenae]
MRQNLLDNAINYIPHAVRLIWGCSSTDELKERVCAAPEGCGFIETRVVNVRELGEEPPVALGSSGRGHDLARPPPLTPSHPTSPDQNRHESDHPAPALHVHDAAQSMVE